MKPIDQFNYDRISVQAALPVPQDLNNENILIAPIAQPQNGMNCDIWCMNWGSGVLKCQRKFFALNSPPNKVYVLPPNTAIILCCFAGAYPINIFMWGIYHMIISLLLMDGCNWWWTDCCFEKASIKKNTALFFHMHMLLYPSNQEGIFVV